MKLKTQLLLFLSLLLLASAVYSQSSRPNILWISCEDLSPHFDFYGDSTVRTPNLSRLAREGVVYERVYSTAGVCAPSRCAIITGVNQVTAGGHNMRTLTNTFPERTGLPQSYSIVAPPEIRAFPEFLRAQGYYCTNNSKTDYQFEAPPTAWDESSLKATWKNRKKGQPFFSVFNLMVTHESQVWVRRNHPLHVSLEGIKVPPIYPDTRTVRQDMARFFSNVVDLDSLVGRLLADLEGDGLLGETIIFFWSDHGDGLPFFKRELYERGTRVPLVVRFPRMENGGSRREQMISTIDFAPTVLSLAGIEPPSYMQGKAFLGKHKAKDQHRYVYAARDRMDSEYDRVRAVRDTRLRYIRNFHPELPPYQDIEYRKQQDMMKEMLELKERGGLDTIQMKWFASRKQPEELYDVEKDPFELRNLAGDPAYQRDLVRMRLEMDRWLAEVRDQGSVPEKELISRMWKGGASAPVTGDVTASRKKGAITLSCETQGASVGYKLIRNGESEPVTWAVYVEPLSIPKDHTLKAIAHRIGYLPSRELTLAK